MRGVAGGLVCAVVAALVGAGCDEAEAPLGPPRCEPPRELVLERFLKEGFRALAEGQAEEAKIRFNAVLVEEATHPEAQLGMRMAQQGPGIAPSRPVTPGGANGAPTSAAGEGRAIAIAGELVPVDLAVERVRFRFEDVSARRRYAFATGLDERRLPLEDWYSKRQRRDGTPVDATKRAAVTEVIDLIVLHDTRTLDVVEALAQMEASGASTHFVIDWDGTVHQTLDLAWEANHAHVDKVDHRSVAIDLVNPVALESAPLPAAAAERGVGPAAAGDPAVARLMRPLSEFVVVQDQEVQAWGYTPAQLESLGALVRALGEVLPAVPMQVPRDAANRVPRAFVAGLADFVGLLGHLHLSPKAVDPGPGFDWETFVRDL